MTKEHRQLRVEALTRLAIATREKLDREAYVLYVDDTQHVELPVFIEACKRLEHRVNWFPKVAELLDECRIVAARRQEQREADARKRLPPATPEGQWRAKDIRRKVEALVKGRRMR